MNGFPVGRVVAGVGAGVVAVAGAVGGLVWWRWHHVEPESVQPKDERRKIWLDLERAEREEAFRDGEGEGFLE